MEEPKQKKEEGKSEINLMTFSKHATNCSLFNINFKLCAFGPHQFTTIFQAQLNAFCDQSVLNLKSLEHF